MEKSAKEKQLEAMIVFLCHLSISKVTVLEMVRHLSTTKKVREDRDLRLMVEKILKLADV